MGWGEAWRLTGLLANDPGTQVCAAVNRWAYPAPRSDLVLRDLVDVTMRAHSRRKPKPYPRPYDNDRKVYGAGTSMTPAEYRALRASMN